MIITYVLMIFYHKQFTSIDIIILCHVTQSGRDQDQNCRSGLSGS